MKIFSHTFESTADCVSETSSSSTSGLGSTLHTATWTPPHSVEGSTPTHTEGTPSFTESSSSGDAGKNILLNVLLNCNDHLKSSRKLSLFC